MGSGVGGNHGQDNNVSPVASQKDFASVAGGTTTTNYYYYYYYYHDYYYYY